MPDTDSTTQDLSSESEWADIWDGNEVIGCEALNLRSRGFDSDLLDFIQAPLLQTSGGTFIELGCFPGTFMRFFAEQGPYQVSGLEYVEPCVDKTVDFLAQEGIQSDVHHGDFRTWQTDRRWDVVASFGLIEHFDDTREVLTHHIRLTNPGGHILVTFPLHCGLYGRVMAWASPDRLAQHNRMSLADALAAASAIDEVEIVKAGYLGRFGFGACRLHNRLDSMFPGSRTLLGLPLRAVERFGRAILPNSQSMSPFAALLLRTKSNGTGTP